MQERYKEIQPVIDYVSGFIPIREEEIEYLLAILNHEVFEKNTILAKQGVANDKAAFILNGAVRSFYIDDDGNEHTIEFVFENNPLVSVDAFLTQSPYRNTKTTLEKTELIWIDRSSFLVFLEKFPRYESAVRNVMSHFMAHDNEQSKLLRISSSRERYETLAKLQPKIIQRVPLKYIASYLGMALETLSRVRAGKL